MHFPGLYMAARIVVGCMFVYSALSKLLQFAGTVQMMQGYQFPQPKLALAAGTLWELSWAVLLLAGVHVLLDSVALAFFVLLATLMFHARDAMKAERRQMATVHIGNNVMIIGGLLAIGAY